MNVNNSSAQPSKRIGRLLEDARRKLVETGTRNRLIHVNRRNAHSNSLNIINERSEDIFEILRLQGRRMKFKAMGKDRAERSEDLFVDVEDEDTEEEFDERRYRDQWLETPLGPDALQKRLLRLFTEARTAEEELGVNILYLAMGFLTWYEVPRSSVEREAPLVLLPVELSRSERGTTIGIRARDDDVVTNLPLQERLKADFGISLPEIDDSEEWTPQGYFEQVAEAIAEQSGWKIDANGMQLGFFSFAKLLMLRDMDPANWPNGSLLGSELVQRLLLDGFEEDPPLFGPNERLDERLDPADIIQILDADASQTRVIEEVRAGHNLVVQGPPGTGKSQTIANIIAGAVHDGKSVLFMAEKMAALDVVHNRLVKAGLRDICLELHSRNANKKAVLQELGRTLNAGRSVSDMPKDPKALRSTRDKLNRIADLLHQPLPGREYSPFTAMAEISRFVGRSTPPPKLSTEGLENLSDSDRRRIVGHIRELAETLRQTGPRKEHPFFGVMANDLQPPDLQRLGEELPAAVAALRELLLTISTVVNRGGLPQARSLGDVSALQVCLGLLARAPQELPKYGAILFPRAEDHALQEALKVGVEWKRSRVQAAAAFTDAALDVSVEPLRPPLSKGVGSLLSRIFGKYRSASAELATLLREPLPKAPGERLALLDKLIEVRRKRSALREEEYQLESALGELWRGERTDFDGLLSCTAWLQELAQTGTAPSVDGLQQMQVLTPDAAAIGSELERQLEHTTNRLGTVLDRLVYEDGESKAREDLDLEQIRQRLSTMQKNMGRYGEWAKLAKHRDQLIQEGLSELIAMLDSGNLAPEAIENEFLYAIAEARWNCARATLAELDEIAQLDRHQLVNAFREQEHSWIKDVRAKVRATHLEQLPKGNSGEMGFIRGQIAIKRGHKPIRKLIAAAGLMVRRIKPVFLMSPISIAQFLPPEAVTFDLLVIDEASQVRPEDALGAVARVNQIVVVGDQKQLPPTNFFDRLTDNVADDTDDDEAEGGAIRGTARATEMESILSLCEARGLNSSMLEWHYRSKDPSLMRVSNAEFYEDRLILAPSPLQLDKSYGLKLTRVPGVYSSKSRGGGRAGTNRIEAEEVAQALAEHARNWPDLSVGVVAFSKAQSSMITEVLENARRQDPILDALLRPGKAEEVFVKNIENVQGDERDVILISVGYGPHEPNGRLASMHFGPVNIDGGERRLNVLFSRARVRCQVFCSFDPDDIDLSRTQQSGPRVLKKYLEFARSGLLDERLVSGLDAESPFEEDVAQVIASLGYPADLQVGSGGFRIDIGVRHPELTGQYILAVECDGAAWHAALWARERDRLRQDVLEGLGWQFHRIWSTDWFHRRDQEIAKLEAALEEAKQIVRPALAGTNQPEREVGQEAREPDDQNTDDKNELPWLELTVPAYQKADIQFSRGGDPTKISVPKLAEMVAKIVEIEGPIHVEEIARRVANGFGKARTGNRIQLATNKALARAKREGQLVSNGRFWMTASQRENPPVRDRSAEGSPTTKSDYLSPLEIQAAATMIKQESGRVDQEELVRAVARLLGYLRVGKDLQSRIQVALRTI